MAIAAGFVEGRKMAQPFRGPELTGAFEPTLLLPTRRLHRSRANRPAPARRRRVIHPSRLPRKIALLLADRFCRSSLGPLQSRDLYEHLLLLTVAHPVQARLHPF